MNLQEKSEKYWGNTVDPNRRKQSYFDTYFKDENLKKSLDFRASKILNQDPDINSILDIGCGYGAFLYNFNNINSNTKLAGIDISKEAIEFCKKTIPTAKFINDKFSNITRHIKENSYDVVYTSGVIIHQAPDTVDNLINDLIKIGKKYIIHFEDIGNNELISGEKDHNPQWRESKQFLWRNNLVKVYQDKGYSFYYGNDVPKDLQRIGFTNYIIVDLQNSSNYIQSSSDRNSILDTKEKVMNSINESI